MAVCFPRRKPLQSLIAAIFIITLIYLIFSHNSWRWQDSGEAHNEPHAWHNIKEPIPPELVGRAADKASVATDKALVAADKTAVAATEASVAPNVVTIKKKGSVYDSSTWAAPNYDVHVFYYAWYGNPDHDKTWHHWNHRYLPHWVKSENLRYPKGRHEPPGDVGANFYPQLGAYSSKDPEVIDRHMFEIRKSRIGVVAVSWYPTGQADDEGEPPDRLIPTLLDAADKYDLKICIHIEPFPHRTAETVRAAIKYIIDKYGKHKAFYRKGDKSLPLFYLYDSYQVEPDEWKKLFSNLETLTVRNTEYDGIFIGLVVEASHPQQMYNSGFDGVYTYFASDTFVYGSMPNHWTTISKYCKERELMFIPSVGPGYIDTEVRPWNSVNTKDRNNGEYYRKNFKQALIALPDIVSITSFNEWHEGTQIEAAIPHERGHDKMYLDYGGADKHSMYMDLTRELIESMPSTPRV